MSDDIRAWILELKGGDPAGAPRAFDRLRSEAIGDPETVVPELCRALKEEHSAGEIETPRLLTLIGVTRERALECMGICLEVLRGLAGAPTGVPSDAALGAAAIVARSDAAALLPDLAAIEADPMVADGIDKDVVASIPYLLAISAQWLGRADEGSVPNMARWLWYDCATHDLKTLADFVGMHLEQFGVDDPILDLFVGLAEQVRTGPDNKRYAGERLEAAGAPDGVVDRIRLAWRAMMASPRVGGDDPALPEDPEPPPPDPKVDEALVMFGEEDEHAVELARAMLDQMLEAAPPSPALVYWLTATVDALDDRRRPRDIDWALIGLGTMHRRTPARAPGVPVATLVRWLETPLLLDRNATRIAVELLSRYRPSLVAGRYVHRAIAVSDVDNAEIVAGDIWRNLAGVEPHTVLLVLSRWLQLGAGSRDLTELLIRVLFAEIHAKPGLLVELEQGLREPSEERPEVFETARKILGSLGDTLNAPDST